MLEPLLYLTSGFMMKIADEAADKWNKKFLGILAGMFCGISLGALVLISIDATYIFFGIFIGTLLAGKIDNINHFLAAAIFLLIILVNGVPALEPVTLSMCTIAALSDELGNKSQWIRGKSNLLRIFFHYRFALKIVVLTLSTIPLFLYPPIHLFRWYSFPFFLLFELSYEIMGRFDDIS